MRLSVGPSQRVQTDLTVRIVAVAVRPRTAGTPGRGASHRAPCTPAGSCAAAERQCTSSMHATPRAGSAHMLRAPRRRCVAPERRRGGAAPASRRSGSRRRRGGCAAFAGMCATSPRERRRGDGRGAVTSAPGVEGFLFLRGTAATRGRRRRGRRGGGELVGDEREERRDDDRDLRREARRQLVRERFAAALSSARTASTGGGRHAVRRRAAPCGSRSARDPQRAVEQRVNRGGVRVVGGGADGSRAPARAAPPRRATTHSLRSTTMTTAPPRARGRRGRRCRRRRRGRRHRRRHGRRRRGRRRGGGGRRGGDGLLPAAARPAAAAALEAAAGGGGGVASARVPRWRSCFFRWRAARRRLTPPARRACRAPPRPAYDLPLHLTKLSFTWTPLRPFPRHPRRRRARAPRERAPAAASAAAAAAASTSVAGRRDGVVARSWRRKASFSSTCLARSSSYSDFLTHAIPQRPPGTTHKQPVASQHRIGASAGACRPACLLLVELEQPLKIFTAARVEPHRDGRAALLPSAPAPGSVRGVAAVWPARRCLAAQTARRARRTG